LSTDGQRRAVSPAPAANKNDAVRTTDIRSGVEPWDMVACANRSTLVARGGAAGLDVLRELVVQPRQRA